VKTLNDKSLFAKRFANAYPEVIYRTEKVKNRLEAIKEQTEKFRAEVEKHISTAIESKAPFKYSKVKELLSDYFEIRGKTAKLDLTYDTFEDIINQNFGKDNVNMLDQRVFSDLEAAFSMLPGKLKVHLRITFKDLGNFTLKDVRKIIESNLAFRAYRVSLRRIRKIRLHLITAAIGVAILVASYFLSDKGYPKIFYDIVNISGTLFIWETVSSMFLSDSYERIESTRLVANIKKVTIVGPDGEKTDLDF
ncbi:MAG: hypothetical protein ACSW73_02970, partial [Spirochaetales bacterium]